MRKTIIYVLLVCLSPAPVLAGLVTAESYSSPVTLQGAASDPVIISVPPKLELSNTTEKLVILPAKLDIKDEIQEFRMFRNRYVIFGAYLSLALYYNWLTRHR